MALSGKGKLELLYTEAVAEYAAQEHPFGYIGHSARSEETDLLLEKVAASIVTVVINGRKISHTKVLGEWLTSTDARHTMDWYEVCDENNVTTFDTAAFAEELKGTKLERIFRLTWYYLNGEAADDLTITFA